MGRAWSTARSTRPEGAPSRTLDRLAELGGAARVGHLMAEAAPRHLRATMRRVRDGRADAYDAALAEALRLVESVRAQSGEVAAAIVEARYLDAERWADAAAPHGMSAESARSLAVAALDRLDAGAVGRSGPT